MIDRYSEPFKILIADDDEDDRYLTQEALKLCDHKLQTLQVSDGQELMNYLERIDDDASHPRPDLILLDLNMPKMDGKECLKAIKSNPALCKIPVVILSTSKAQVDVLATYQLGVNAFITKPMSFKALIDKMAALRQYWFEVVELPV